MTAAADVSGPVLHVCNSIYNYQNWFVNSDEDFFVHKMTPFQVIHRVVQGYKFNTFIF